MSPGNIYGELRKGTEREWDGPCQDGKQHTEWEIKAGSLGGGERKRRSRLPLSSFHMWTLSSVPQPLISSVCLIASVDTCIDPSLTASGADCPSSLLPSLPRVFPSLFLWLPSPSFVDTDVPCRGGCFQKYIFLITYLPVEGCASLLGWVSKKKLHSECRVSSPSQRATDKEKWALSSAPIQDGCWCWVVYSSGKKASLKQPGCNLGSLQPDKLYKKTYIILLFSFNELKIPVKHI